MLFTGIKILISILSSIVLIQIFRSSRQNCVNLIIYTTLFLIFLTNRGFSLHLQEFILPEPSGPYSIGTRYFYLVDNRRPDIFTEEPDDYRGISAQVWYPAAIDSHQIFQNFNHEETAGFWVKMGLFIPEFIEEVANKPSYSVLNARVANEKSTYPVLLYSASGVLDANILLAEELASHGYVVFCLGHPHWCAYYFDGQGNVFFRDEDKDQYNKKLWEEENSDIVRQLKEQLTKAETLDQKVTLQNKLNENMPLEINDIGLWAADVSFIIDELMKLNQSDHLFTKKLDLQKIAVLGYSKGGAAAGQVCLIEKRCKAGINLSGFMFGDIAEKELTVPFMVIEGMESWCKDCLPINDLLYHTSKSSVYMIQIEDATHGNFCDISAFPEYLSQNYQGILGSIDGRKFLKIQNDYVLQFFNKHLKGIAAPLLNENSDVYSEVKYKARFP
jgi:predicted dienelactone hydrolase